MAKHISIQEYPVFEKGVFKKHPALFEPYSRNIPEHQKKKYQKMRKALPKYEETYQWQLISGPGFCGTTHPGTGKIFHGVMTGATHPVYNSDCLYVNPSQNVFAISDPPGITTFSRGLITQLDERLQSEPVGNLEAIINEVNRNAGNGLRDRSTLALIHFPPDNPGKALTLLSGDSLLFHGNTLHKRITRLPAVTNRWGTPNAYFELQQVNITEGDFFVLASDGITAVRPNGKAVKLDTIILNLAISDPDNFALNVAITCNQIIEEENAGQVRTTFGGGDDISVTLIDPAEFRPDRSEKSYILGGYFI